MSYCKKSKAAQRTCQSKRDHWKNIRCIKVALAGGINCLELIPGLFRSYKIRALSLTNRKANQIRK
jgi:hypothetical protein